MIILLIVCLAVLWVIFFFTIMKPVYDRLTWVCGLVIFLILVLSDFPKVMAALHGVLLILGCTFVIVAVWSEINDFTLVSLDDRRFSFLINSARLSERQKIFRLNCYAILTGLLFVVSGLLGVLSPGTFIGFPFEK